MKVVVTVVDWTLVHHCDIAKGEIYDVIETKEVYSKARGNHKQYFVRNSEGQIVKLYDTEVREFEFKTLTKEKNNG